MAQEREIILYHYPGSPYARRLIWYLNLRGIPYTQCFQPPMLPRPDLVAIGTSYRRIPVVAIGRDVYSDTRLIIQKLETLYPSHAQISSTTADGRALEAHLRHWIVDGGVFARASQLIPTSAPIMNDPRFLKDRQQLSGRAWSKEAVERNRPEALVAMCEAFTFLEGILTDGRLWIGRTDGPALADIEGVWPFHWLTTMPGALPPSYISAERFPKTFAWIARFNQVVKAAAKSIGKPKTISGKEAVALIEAADFAEGEGDVDAGDPLGLAKGDLVEVFPTDSGFSHRDQGRLVTLNLEEIVIDSQTEGGKAVRVHTPRHGFRVRRAPAKGKL